MLLVGCCTLPRNSSRFDRSFTYSSLTLMHSHRIRGAFLESRSKEILLLHSIFDFSLATEAAKEANHEKLGGCFRAW
jgi:hypothetical protein